MTVEYCQKNKASHTLELGKTHYVLPDSGKILIKKVRDEFFFINKRSFDRDSEFEITVERENITIEADGQYCEIVVLAEEIPQETVLSYKDLYKAYRSHVDQNGLFTVEGLSSAFDAKSNKLLPLCSFDRQFENITKASNRDELLQYVKFLPHIFYRPKIHLKQIEEVRPAAIVTRIGPEAIRHLASHSEHWKGIKVSGLVPERLLAKVLEDDYAIYENRAVKTLVDKLYRRMKKEKEDALDCKMQSSLNDSYSVGREQQNVHDAIHTLSKGLNDKESSLVQELLEKALATIEQILHYLSQCRASPLYRELKRSAAVSGSLKKTNIFMMDTYYKQAYLLWNLFSKSEDITELPEKESISGEYFVYCELLLLFALHFFNFKPDDSSKPLLQDGEFHNVSFSFKYWNITVNSENPYIYLKMTKKIEYPIEFKNISLPDSDIAKYGAVKKNNATIAFSRKLSDSEQQKLADILSEKIEKNRETWKKSFIRQLHDGLQNFSENQRTIVFVPWKYGFIDDSEKLKKTVSQLKEQLPQDYDEWYILTIGRPNDFSNIEDIAILQTLDSYSLANKESNGKQTGIIPVSINDINSFRRFTKILLKNMILIDDDYKYCPICGTNMQYADSKHICYTCNLHIVETICADCHKKYVYTDYELPKTLDIKSDVVGMNVLLNENERGFKNITEVKIQNERIEKPICPYCKQGLVPPI